MASSLSSSRKKALEAADPQHRIAELVKLTCESGGPAPDPELLKALKREVRGSDAAMHRAHQALLVGGLGRGCSVIGCRSTQATRVHSACVDDVASNFRCW